MSARVIVTQQSTRGTLRLKHDGYDVESLGLDKLGGVQILAEPGFEIAAIYIVDAK